ncbi:MAG: nucleotidyltransferase family protein [Acidobacteria bacterium]|nr:nucleotidyltransferase family protein [Acidobacteriota bacterium]
MQTSTAPKRSFVASSRPVIDNVVRALRFGSPDAEGLRAIPARSWKELLDRTDRAQLTLPLGCRAMHELPPAVQDRIGRDLANNARRHARFAETYDEIRHGLTAHGVDFVFLKGLTHTPYYTRDLRARPQYDIDLYCPPAQAGAALRAITALGFEPFASRTPGRVDHLPTMIRKTGWQWKGDYYDPSLPPAIEIHFRFWDPDTEGFDVAGPNAFWTRRTGHALCLADKLSYAALHLLRHLLRGDLRLYHAYELAHFLEYSASDQEFWTTWQGLTPPSLQAAAAIAFRLAAELFHCRPHPIPQRAVNTLPRPVATWFELFAFSPVAALDRPNKDDLLLHLALVTDAATGRRIAFRRIFPALPTPVVLHPHVRRQTARLRLERWLFRLRHLAGRAHRHAASLPSLTVSAVRWWWALRRTAATGRTLPAGSGPE